MNESKPFALYVHIPFCAVRCGYCDFNTYVADFGPGASRQSIASTLIQEITQVREALGPRRVESIFYGGGTPTQLPGQDLVGILEAIAANFEIAPGAEITTEANPDTVTPTLVQTLAAGGFTRVSLGMQSARESVLATLDRTHNPAQVGTALQLVRQAGMDVSVDLIYGTPGESLSDWQSSLETAISYQPDHISAYSLVIEPGTKMGADLAQGRISAPDPDLAAQMYQLADQTLAASGYHWYEISNFARCEDPSQPLQKWPHASKHNLAYWRDWDWWGFGPGAHSHIGDMRAWNVKHPLKWAAAVRAKTPGKLAGFHGVADYEQLGAKERQLERVMLAIRTRSGLKVRADDDLNTAAISELVAQGLVVGATWAEQNRVVLTLRGRLLADLVTRQILPD